MLLASASFAQKYLQDTFEKTRFKIFFQDSCDDGETCCKLVTSKAKQNHFEHILQGGRGNVLKVAFFIKCCPKEAKVVYKSFFV